jgi:hypothetical protein
VRRVYKTCFLKTAGERQGPLRAGEHVRGTMKLGLLLALFSISAAAAQGRDPQWQRRMHEDFENFARHNKCIDDNTWEMDWQDKISDAATLVSS